MASPIAQKIAKTLGSRVIHSRALPGGDIADVSLLTLENHTKIVAKRPRTDQPDTTAVEAHMLHHLAQNSELPVPKVLLQSTGLLVLGYVPHRGNADPAAAAENIADHIATLHRVRPTEPHPYYGHTQDTFIGPLPQINTPSENWARFFAEQRLMTMARSCLNTYRFDEATFARIEMLASKLGDLLPAQPHSSLLHGDLWAGNILIDGNHAAAFIDPAISYGHREMDLAFIDLMGGLTSDFFDRYHANYALEPDFHQERKALYQLWPLLVHVRLFGGGYVGQVEETLKQFGC